MTDPNLGQTILDRLEVLEKTLGQLCVTTDLLLSAVNDLLQHRGGNGHAAAVSELYAERSAEAAERREAQERDTEPPEAP